MSEDWEKAMAALTARVEDQDARLDKLIEAQEINATNIANLTEATTGVVEAWTVANGLSKFLKWLSSFAIIGVGFIWLKDFIK
tara:strand:+ start:2515 stop:2763 length:249 start_codon:yes stop_codon:yes gene_type:complete